MRFYLLLFVIHTIGLESFAQEMPIPTAYGRSIAFGASGNYNLSKSGSAYYIGIGAFGTFELPFKTVGLNGIASIGVTNFFENRVTKNFFRNPKGLSFTNYNYINIDVGVKYYLSPPFYITASSGVLYGLQSISKTAFTCLPGAGFALPFHNAAIDFSTNYIIVIGGYSTPLSNTGHLLNFKLAYKLRLKAN